jgi:peptidoglycan hydrolase CwlO-like protein
VLERSVDSKITDLEKRLAQAATYREDTVKDGIKRLEDKLDKIDRMYIDLAKEVAMLQRDSKTAFAKIDELREDIHAIENDAYTYRNRKGE